MFPKLTWTYPQGRTRAVTFSYDDGAIFDRKVVDCLNRHGMKGTFNLNSALILDDKQEGVIVRAEEIPSLYEGHEVAVHAVHHPFLERLNAGQILAELLEDRRNLERIVHYPVTGMAFPFGTWNQEVLSQMKAAGITYARTTEAQNNFLLPENWLLWHPTCHHADALPLVEKFRNQKYPLALFYIWGHSYEFDRQNNWELLEQICDALPQDNLTWYATNGQIQRYLQAIHSLVFTTDLDAIYNPTDQTLWFRNESTNTLETLSPGKTKEVGGRSE